MNVDLETVKKQYDACKALIETLLSTKNKLMSVYIFAGTTWNDRHYAELGSIVSACCDSLEKGVDNVAIALQGLSSILAALQEYDEVHFGGGASGSPGVATAARAASAPASPNSIQNVMAAGLSWAQGLRPDEMSAVRAYTGTAYRNINAALRGLEAFTMENLGRAPAIHSALSRASIPEACVVYRGVSSAALGPYAHASDEELVGCVIGDGGFMSTSLRRGDAFGGDLLLEIHVPAGANGAYVGHISESGHYESEVLFDSGQTLRITDVRRDFFGRRVVCARMI